MNTVDAYQAVKQTIPAHVHLVAVSKTKPNDAILEVYHLGQRIFGENKVQELCSKYEVLPLDIEWHLIGHLQSNKVKFIAPFVSLIHAVDSLKLLAEINKEAQKNKRVISCLLQIYIAKEESKFGLSIDEANALLASPEFASMENIKIAGLMGMATNTSNQEVIKSEFKSLHTYFNQLKIKTITNCNFEILSMGMSSDYQLAIECGSNMVRIGSSIFGSR